MAEFFPVRHSILDANAVGQAAAEKYALPGPIYCELLHRGMNDVYAVRTPEARYALRSWRAHWRTIENVQYELEFLEFLVGQGIPVPAPVRLRDGSRYFTVEAPEGLRPMAMFRWAPGRPFGAAPSVETAQTIGELFARMHTVAAHFVPSGPRRTNPPSDLQKHLPELQALVGDRPLDLAFYTRLAEELPAALEAIDPKIAPMGPTHGDFHFNNVNIDETGQITLLDFDNAGEDFLLQDVMCYVWANEYGRFDQVYATAFLGGYERQRPMREDERALAPLFLLAKEFRLISGFAHHHNATGYFPLRFRDLDWFSQSLRRHAAEAGLSQS